MEPQYEKQKQNVHNTFSSVFSCALRIVSANRLLNKAARYSLSGETCLSDGALSPNTLQLKG